MTTSKEIDVQTSISISELPVVAKVCVCVTSDDLACLALNIVFSGSRQCYRPAIAGLFVDVGVGRLAPNSRGIYHSRRCLFVRIQLRSKRWTSAEKFGPVIELTSRCFLHISALNFPVKAMPPYHLPRMEAHKSRLQKRSRFLR